MTTDSEKKFIAAVIDLFLSGKATEAHYIEMARAVLHASEDHETTPVIDDTLGFNEDEP